MKRIVFIINPISGKVNKNNIVSVIDSEFLKSEVECSIVSSEYPGHATEICKNEIERGVDTIVAVGGDGSVNEIAKVLVESETSLGIIPAGSGNGLAHHLKIPVNISKAIEIISRNKAVKIDTGSINENLFVSIAGVGFDGLVAKKFSMSERRGFLSYLRIVTEEYHGYKPKKYQIEVNGELLSTRALFISFANSDQFGYQASIAPGAIIDDGLLNISIVQKPKIIEFPWLASLLYWRKIDLSKHINTINASELIVKSKKKRWVNIDGEARKLGKTLTVKVNPKSLNVIVP